VKSPNISQVYTYIRGKCCLIWTLNKTTAFEG
ncbi:unnamed protein product, partial [marine sediment metagenome]